MENLDHALHVAIRAADVLKLQLRDIAGDDVDLIRDMIEGETPLRDLINLAAEQNLIDNGTVNGISGILDSLRDRKTRIEKRIDMRRSAILAAMQTSELHSFVTPSGTISRKVVPASALVLDETAVPSKFWRPQDPRLDKKAVLDALKAGEDVPGAMMSNGGETLQVRV